MGQSGGGSGGGCELDAFVALAALAALAVLAAFAALAADVNPSLICP